MLASEVYTIVTGLITTVSHAGPRRPAISPTRPSAKPAGSPARVLACPPIAATPSAGSPIRPHAGSPLRQSPHRRFAEFAEFAGAPVRWEAGPRRVRRSAGSPHAGSP